MNPSEVRLSHISNLLIAVSGIGLGIYKYLFTSNDEFSAISHPFEPFFLKFHLLAVPLILFSLGITFNVHILPKLKNNFKKKRLTGLILLGLAIPMVFSGILLQIIISENLLLALKWVHGVTSGLWVFIYFIHILFKNSMKEKAT
jgi:hypothetical protein